MNDAPARILVTGAAGFLGLHLTRALLAAGEHVLAVDNFYTSTPEGIEALQKEYGPARLVIRKHDVRRPLAGTGRLAGIYHLACPASPQYYQRDPFFTLETNYDGARNVLALARQHGCPVLLASTSETYGEPEVSPQPETYRGNVNTVGPRACYDEGKRVAETLFYEAHQHWGVDARIARIFNTYGPGMGAGDGRVVSNFISQALAEEPLTVYGGGGQTRSLCYVDDTIEGLHRLGRMPRHLLSDAASFLGPVNLGNPVEVTIADLAPLVAELTGSTSPLAVRPLPQDDPTNRRPDIRKASSVLGWHPTVPLREGLRRTIAWFREEAARVADPAA